MSLFKIYKSKYDEEYKIVFDNGNVKPYVQKEVEDIIKEAEVPYEAMVLKYGKDKVYYHPKLNIYYLSI